MNDERNSRFWLLNKFKSWGLFYSFHVWCSPEEDLPCKSSRSAKGPTSVTENKNPTMVNSEFLVLNLFVPSSKVPVVFKVFCCCNFL